MAGPDLGEYAKLNAQDRLNAAIEFANSGRPESPSVAPPSQPSADAKRLSMFEGAADKYGVPVDVLLGMAEKDSNFNPLARSQGVGSRRRGIIAMSDDDVARDGINPYIPSQAIDSAAKKIKNYMDQGLSVDDAIKAYVGGPDRGQWGPQTDEYLQDILSRSKRLADQYYPVDPSVAPSQDAPQAAQQNSEIGDVGLQVVGGAAKGAGATIQGAAEVSQAVRHAAGIPEYRSMGDALAEAFNKWGAGVQEGVSPETKQAIADSSPGGNILKPGTWTLGKNPSLRGYAYLGLDIFGQ
ncbi:MAG: transglycosylase SLT domain-containing protein, partial [Methylomonas sp.]|nr:transglycosylase SLT domain-containing protein [Methylomonas sp.]